MIYDYLQSLANFIEVERITLLGFQQSINNSICKIIQNKLKSHNTNCISDGPIVYKGEELIPFDQYQEHKEFLIYNLMLHCMRIIFQLKLINKSMNLREEDRLQTAKKAQSSGGDSKGIAMDLFQINQNLKNDSGIDVDIIEGYFLDSIKSVFIAANEYLSKVPQGEPQYRKNDTDHLDHRTLVRDDEIFIDDLLSSDEDEPVIEEPEKEVPNLQSERDSKQVSSFKNGSVMQFGAANYIKGLRDPKSSRG